MNQTCWYVFHIIVNANSIVQITFQIIKWNNDTCQCECKKYQTSEMIIVGLLAHVFVRIISI